MGFLFTQSFLFFSWNTVDLQCCVSFRCDSVTHTHTYSIYRVMKVKSGSVSHSVRLFGIAWTVAPPGSCVPGIFLAWILEWVVVSFSKGSSRSRDQTQVSRTADGSFATLSPGKPKESNLNIALRTVSILEETLIKYRTYVMIWWMGVKI